jgi:Pyrimidine dimer DNA glycosylase
MVNTFLPYADFSKSASSLDVKRLGKQRLEARQIIRILTGEVNSRGYRNHPATKMWKDNIDALKLYYNIIVKEWINRGYKNTMELYEIKNESEITMPWWFGNQDFHYAHQASLVRKNETYYKDKFQPPKKYLKKGYIWPKIIDGKQIMERGAVPAPSTPR